MRAHANDLPQRRRGETRTRRRPASPIAPPGLLAGSPESIARREIISNVRSHCSNPAATTIWPSASDMTPASPQCLSWRLRHGRSARSIARFLAQSAQERIAAITHVGTHTFGRTHAAMFEVMRGDRARAAPNALELARLAREHDLSMWRAFAVFFEGWAGARRRACRWARGHASRRRTAARTERSDVRRAFEDCAGRGRNPGGRSRPRRRHPRRSAGDVRPHRLSRVRSGTASGPRRNAADARFGQPRARRRGLP